MRRAAFILATIVALAGCDTQPEVDVRNASVGEVAREVGKSGAGDSMIRAGKWESTVQIDAEASGMPAAAKAMLEEMNKSKQVHSTCLTPEDVKRPKEDFFAGNENKNCRYDHFTMGDGKIDAKMRCTNGAMTSVMTMKGDYSPDSYTMRMTTSAEGGPAAAGGMAMAMRVDAKRVGECDGKQG